MQRDLFQGVNSPVYVAKQPAAKGLRYQHLRSFVVVCMHAGFIQHFVPMVVEPNGMTGIHYTGCEQGKKQVDFVF